MLRHQQSHSDSAFSGSQSKEAQKLAQRIALAEEQFDQGLRKLTAASKQLASLKRQVSPWLRGSTVTGELSCALLSKPWGCKALAMCLIERASVLCRAAAPRKVCLLFVSTP